MEKARAGDKEAQEDLFAHLLGRFRYLARRKLSADDADEVAQEAVLTVLNKYQSETFHKGFDQWSYGVLQMTLLRFQSQRSRSRQVGVDSEILDTFSSTSHSDPETILHLKDCLGKLAKSNPLYLRLLNLKSEGYKTKEACKRVNLKPGTYDEYVHRAKIKLATCLEIKKRLL